jgi:glycosyltransferase involved in cell wall biosynthesis
MARAGARADARVLWLSAETPDRDGGGGQRRQYHQIRALIDGGVDLRVAALAGGQQDASLREIVPVVRFAPADARVGGGSLPTLAAFLAGERFDRAVVAHVESVPYVHDALASHRIPWLLDFQNVNSRWHRARRERRRTWTWLRRERTALARASLATACSPAERAALLGHAGNTPIEVAGNGIAPEEWPAGAISRERESRLVLFGSWIHTPNREGAEWLCREVWPAIRAAVPEARLLLAGPGEPPPSVLSAAGVEHRGRVADLARLLGGVAVAVVPIVTGIGSRVKFGEALASGTAVVSTSVGAEGFDAEGAFLRADAPDAFAQACVGLLREPAQAAALGRAGRALAFERFTWQRTSAPVVRWALGGDSG